MLSADSQIHWLSISNSCLIVLFLTGMVGMILMKTIHADFRRYSDMEQVIIIIIIIILVHINTSKKKLILLFIIFYIYYLLSLLPSNNSHL